METSNNKRCKTLQIELEISGIMKKNYGSTLSPNMILNHDCFEHVFKFLPLLDRIRIERVCKHWKKFSEENWIRVKRLNSDEKYWGCNLLKKNKFEQSLILKEVLNRCGFGLTDLHLDGMNIDTSTLWHVGNLCPNLEYINIEKIALNYLSANAIAKNCSKIRILCMGPCKDDCTDEDISKIFLANKNMRKFVLNGNSNLTGKCLHDLANTVETLVIEQCLQISSQYIFSVITKFEMLHTLMVIKSPDVSHLKRHFKLHLNDLTIALPNGLKMLKMVDQTFFRVNFNLTPLNALQVLDISSTYVDNESIFILSDNCKNLSSLNIDDCQRITDSGMEAVANFPLISTLSIRKLNKISDAAFGYMPTLKKLYCSECPNIKEERLCLLIISSCGMVELDLKNCFQVTNKLVHQAITICNCRQDNEILSIDLRGTSVDKKKISKLPSTLKLLLE